MIRVVFSDVDGTLLDSNKNVLPATRDSIAELISAGVRFAIVTARPPMGVYPILNKNGFNCTIVAYGGGLLLDEKGTVLGSTTMEADTAEEILRFVEEERFPLAWNLYAGDKWLVRDVNDPFDHHPEGGRGGVDIIDLANLSSCAFIQTQDIGRVMEDGSFVIEGRIAGSDIRGCNLLVHNIL